MTAIPGDHDPNSLVLICDGCGRTRGAEGSPQDWKTLWGRAFDAGWRGSDRRVGPHNCLHCAG
ncbi:hypothetical protein [Saccharothrix australiensis]|uniref:Uncharacterized protein n=1 Tax=Saccharothrix australiensis TaxID=2072 RepID=A0A495VYI1_9PSEU|nr:hypothetical protein [Saccharothrix australiensis]RKT53797.1 hypothetical protein C8E97_2379 [Saccharothrix australiensis]